MTVFAARVRTLQGELRAAGIDAWIAPSADPHQSEYVAAHWQARAWLSGFSGSAGTLVITPRAAGLWTDSRYHLRAATELAGSGIALFRQGLPDVPTYTTWLQQNLADHAIVGFDGRLLSIEDVAQLDRALAGKQIRFDAERDLVAPLWGDRPPLPDGPIFLYDERFAGESRRHKLARLRAAMRACGADFHLLTALDDIAWTLNIRGRDVDYNPVAIAYALVSQAAVQLFIDGRKVSEDVREALGQDGVVCREYAAVDDCWAELPRATVVLLDPAQCSYRLGAHVAEHCAVQQGESIPRGLKSVKNAVELAGLRQAQVRDGAAMVRWLVWLEEAIRSATHTEITVAEKLTDLRSQGERYQGLSFGTIVGYGANSAIGHYRARPETTPIIRPAGILLVDSGAHYLDGTTDITRTISLGAPTVQQKRVFTLALKAHIKLATAIFPRGTRGDQLDALPRELFWREGWECRHGIGHGVGHFLNVHEGPPRFSSTGRCALTPGMVLSNEPGVYFANEFGVRLENMLIVVPVQETPFGEFYGFETVTLCPFDRTLIDPTQLADAELDWLNAYHSRVHDHLKPHLSACEQAWLRRATARIERGLR